MATGIVEGSIDFTKFPYNVLGVKLSGGISSVVSQELEWPAKLMQGYLGYWGDDVIRLPDDIPLLLEQFGNNGPRYLNFCQAIKDDPLTQTFLLENFVNCVVKADPSKCLDNGVENAGQGLQSMVPSSGCKKVTYANPNWRFRLGFSPANLNYTLSLQTFSMGAHTDHAFIENGNGRVVYRAEMEAWDNYDWANNEDPNDPDLEGFHPFGMRASDFNLLNRLGFAVPYTMFGGLNYAISTNLASGCPSDIPANYQATISCVNPNGETDTSYVSVPLSRSGFTPYHTSTNTDNVLHYP